MRLTKSSTVIRLLALTDGFTEEDCEYTESYVDCDGDGDQDIRQVMECSSTEYDWMFECGDCPE